MSEHPFIPLSVPNICGNELKYVRDCLETGWISSVGSYVNQFEEMVAEYAGAKYGIAAVNGTAALHVCLNLLGVGLNDYVIIPNLTFVATANAVKYTGADPILVDADPGTWQMDLTLLESFLAKETVLSAGGDRVYAKDHRIIRAIMPVHVQGNLGDMDALLTIAAKYNLPVIEDSTEALGSRYRGRHSGTFGKMGTFSFNGNKILSTGGGGVIVTDDDTLAKQAKHITTTAKTDPMEYFHDQVGFNYRLVNVLAAIGVAQMELLDEFVRRKKEIGEFYRNALHNVADIRFQEVLPEVDHNNWLFTIQTDHQKELLRYLNSRNIISRPFWMPMYKLPMYKNCLYISEKDNSDYIHKSCLAIPCSTNISNQELEIVADAIKAAIG